MSDEKHYAGHRERLRERFRASGLEGFHEYEAVELLLTYAIPRRDVKPLAKKLAERFGLRGLAEASPEDIEKVDGVGGNASVLLTLAGAVARIYLDDRAGARAKVRSPEDALSAVEKLLPEGGREGHYAVYLNTKNEVLGVVRVDERPEPIGEWGKGGDGQARAAEEGRPIRPRKVLEEAFSHNARSIIFVRFVSDEFALPAGFDRRLMDELNDAASAIDIIVHDHVLAARESHLSAREAKLMKGGGGGKGGGRA